MEVTVRMGEELPRQVELYLIPLVSHEQRVDRVRALAYPLIPREPRYLGGNFIQRLERVPQLVY